MTDFSFELPAYSQPTVIRLLRNYMQIRMRLIDGMPVRPAPLYTTSSEHHSKRERPLGAVAGQAFPFMERPKAQPSIDGKKKARMIEELHVAAIDLEEALEKLSPDDYDLTLKYFILQTHNLDELCAERHLSSKGGMQERLQRIVKRLVRTMNGTDHER